MAKQKINPNQSNYQSYRCHVGRTATQSLSTGNNIVMMNSKLYDPSNMYNTGTGEVQFPETGVYRVSIRISAGNVRLFPQISQTQPYEQSYRGTDYLANGSGSSGFLSVDIMAVKGQYMLPIVYSSGSTTTEGTTETYWMTVQFVGA